MSNDQREPLSEMCHNIGLESWATILVLNLVNQVLLSYCLSSALLHRKVTRSLAH